MNTSRANTRLSVSAMLVVLFLLMTLMFTSACKHEPILPSAVSVTSSDYSGNSIDSGTNYSESTCDPDTVYFANDILPLFISNCAKSGCHDAASHQEGIILDTYSHIISTGNIE